MKPWRLALLAFALVVNIPSISGMGTKYIQCPGTTLDPIIQKGKRYFNSVTGEYFPIKGIVYYPRPNNGTLSISNSVDFYTDEYSYLWQEDIKYFSQLGVNTIRIYSVDPSKNHDNFMCALQQAGIYVILGLLADCENCGIGPNEAPSCYPISLKQRGQWIINEFSKYSNLLVFSAGNEVTLYARNQTVQVNAPCQKKFIRDMRSYVKTCSANPASILPRKVPIGMANWDHNRTAQALYFNCRTNSSDELENAEWYGQNAYLQCDPNVTNISQLVGWQQLLQDYTSYNLSVPVVISEYGCRARFPTIGKFQAQRTWVQVDALYSPSYVQELAGAVVFEYSAEKRVVDTSPQGAPWPYYKFMKLQYGVGYYSPVTCDDIAIPCVYNPYPEFDLLSTKLHAVDNSYVPNIDSYVSQGEIPDCPSGFAAIDDFVWPVDDQPDLPCYLVPTNQPTMQPSLSLEPSAHPSKRPTTSPSKSPAGPPSANRTAMPSTTPSTTPLTGRPTTSTPSLAPTKYPSFLPSSSLSANPTRILTMAPSKSALISGSGPTGTPEVIQPTSVKPTRTPTIRPSKAAPMSQSAPTGTPEVIRPTTKPTSVLSTIDAPAAFAQSPSPVPTLTQVPVTDGATVSSNASDACRLRISFGAQVLSSTAFVLLFLHGMVQAI